MASDDLAFKVMRGVEEEGQERDCAVMLCRAGARPACIASCMRTLRAYRAAGVPLISAVITPETRQLLAPNASDLRRHGRHNQSGSSTAASDAGQAARHAAP